MKKILALLLALSMAALAVSCGNKEEEKIENNVKTEEGTEKKNEATEEEKKEQDKTAAKAAVDGFMSAYCAYDIAKMSEFTNTNMSAKLGIENYTDFISTKIKSYFTEQETNEVYAEEIAKLEAVCKKAILGSASYEITDAEYVDNNWNFDVTVKNITVSDIFSILHGDKAQELTQQLLDELIVKLENPEITEEEMMEVTQEMLKASLNAIVSLVNESCETTEPKATEYTLSAIKSGDKWIVDYNGEGAQALGDSLLDNVQ